MARVNGRLRIPGPTLYIDDEIRLYEDIDWQPIYYDKYGFHGAIEVWLDGKKLSPGCSAFRHNEDEIRLYLYRADVWETMQKNLEGTVKYFERI